MALVASKTAAVSAASVTGYLTVVSNEGFFIDAVVTLYKTGVTSQQCRIVDMPSATQIGVRLLSSEPFNYGRSNASAFTGGGATVYQPAQDIPSIPEDNNIVAGAGLVLVGNTISVGPPPDGSINVNADDVQVGILASDAQHGNRSGGSLHSLATTSVAGFLSAADKQKIDDGQSQTITITVRNESGVTISKGMAVAVVGNHVSGAYLINLADYMSGSLRPAIGIASADIPNNTTTTIISVGKITGLDTSGFALTDQLVLGPTGTLIQPPPATDPFPGKVQCVASIVRVHATLGEIFVTCTQGLEVLTGAQSYFIREVSMTGQISGGDVVRNGPLTLDVTSGVGFVNISDVLTRVSWAGVTALPVTPNTNFVVYVDETGTIFCDTVEDPRSFIVLARGYASGSEILVLTAHEINLHQSAAQLYEYARDVIGPVAIYGLAATAIGATLTLQTDVGEYYLDSLRLQAAATSPITYTYWFRNGLGGWTGVSGLTVVFPDIYDNGTGTPATVPVGQYKKDLLFTSVNDSNTEFHIVMSQAVFTSQEEAVAGLEPSPPDQVLSNSVRIAGIVTQEAATDIAQIVDRRPFLGQLATGSISTNDHGLLTGLSDDDHPQYQLLAEKDIPGGYAGLNGSGIISAATHGNQTTGTLHAVVTGSVPGFMSVADKTKLDGLPSSAVPTSRIVTAGAGLTGGGNLTADITLDVVANADGSIVVAANDVKVGILATDAQHGTRGGGTLHANVVAAGAAGFMTGADKTKLDGLPTAAVPTSRQVIAGAGLTGGGALSADVTLNVVANADGSIVVAADDVKVGVLATDAQHGNRGGGGIHSNATTSVAGFMSGADKTALTNILTGWIAESNAWTFVSVDGSIGVIDITGNATLYLSLGDRIRYTQTTVKYGIVHKIDAFGGGLTRIYVYGGTDYATVNAAISAISYSFAKAPFGFNPAINKWSQTLDNDTGNFTANPTAAVWTAPGAMSIDIPIGSWRGSFDAGMRCLGSLATGTTCTMFLALSTSNSSSADTSGNSVNLQTTGAGVLVVATAVSVETRQVLSRTFFLTLTAKTTFHLITKTSTASMQSIGFDGANSRTQIKLVSAYL